MLVLERHGKAISPGCLAFSPDGRLLASGSLDGTVRVWDSFAGEQLGQFTHPEAVVGGVEFALAGKVVVSGCGDRTVRIWPVSFAVKGRKTHRINSAIRSLAVAPNGRSVAVGTSYGTNLSNRNQFFRWDLKSGKRLPPAGPHGPGPAIEVLAFSPDGRYLASGPVAAATIIWNLANVGDPRGHVAHRVPPRAVAFSSDGRWLASAAGKEVRLFDMAAWEESGKLTHSDTIRGVAFTPDGQSLAAAGDDRLVTLWDTEKAARRTVYRWNVGKLRALACSPDGMRLAAGSESGKIVIWDVDA